MLNLEKTYKIIVTSIIRLGRDSMKKLKINDLNMLLKEAKIIFLILGLDLGLNTPR